MVVQVVKVSIRPEQRDRWLELIRMNAAQTRAEQGCESYQIREDVEAPNDFLIVEQWGSLEAQYDHFRNPEFGKLMGSLRDVLAAPPEVSIHEVASTFEEVLSGRRSQPVAARQPAASPDEPCANYGRLPGGPRTSMACSAAIVVNGSTSGSGRSAGGKLSSAAGSPAAATNASNPAGAFTSRSRAGLPEVTCSVCGTLIGVLTHSPGPTTNDRPGRYKVNSPSSTYRAWSESLWT